MSSFPLVKYVDSPSTTATVRYDFNDQAATPSKKVTEFDPGVPTLEGDPDAVGQQWGFRTPSITHTIRGTKAQAMAALAAVSREQLRRTNWLLFQPSAAQQPVWFKTYRTGYQPITLDRVYVRVDGGGQAPVPDTWKITVPLVADAFTYGARVNAVVGATLTMNSTTANPMRYVLPAIKGDAPTGLRVTVTSTPASYSTPETWLLGCIAGDATMVDPFNEIGLADGFTAPGGSGTAAGTASAAYSGGSYRAVTIGAATPNLIERLNGQHTGLASGRYKVLLRAELDGTVAGKTYLLQYVQKNSITLAPYPGLSVSIAVPASQIFQGWADLGDFTFPLGNAPAPSGIASLFPPPFGLRIGTSDGSAGTARIDAFKFIPVDGNNISSAKILKTTYPISPLRTSIYDTDLESIWQLDITPAFLEAASSNAGAFPMADPAAAQNVLHLIPMTTNPTALGATGYHASVATTATLDVSYHPRYLHVGDGS